MVAEPARAADAAAASTAPIDVSEGVHEQKPPSPPVGDDAVVSLPTTTTSSVSDSMCFDCESELSDPWTSVTYGITLCLSCAGAHRSLGVHMSFVRSLTLDTLSESEQRALALGGNGAFADFLADPARGVSRKVWAPPAHGDALLHPGGRSLQASAPGQARCAANANPHGDDLRKDRSHVRPPAPSAAHGALAAQVDSRPRRAKVRVVQGQLWALQLASPLPHVRPLYMRRMLTDRLLAATSRVPRADRQRGASAQL